MTSTDSTGRGLHNREVTFEFWGGGGDRSASGASAGVFVCWCRRIAAISYQKQQQLSRK